MPVLDPSGFKDFPKQQIKGWNEVKKRLGFFKRKPKQVIESVEKRQLPVQQVPAVDNKTTKPLPNPHGAYELASMRI